MIVMLSAKSVKNFHRFLQKIDLPGEKRKIANFSLLPWQINLLQKPEAIHTLFSQNRNAHKGTQHPGHDDGSVGLMIGFKDGGHGPTDGQAGGVEGVDVFSARALTGAIFDVGSPRLEGFAIADRGDFKVAPLSSHPDLQVESFRGREGQITGAELDNTIR